MALNNRLLNNTKKFLYYINYGKHARQREVLPVKRPLESARQRANKLKKIHKIMRQRDARRKKSIKRRDKKKIKLNLKRRIKFIC